MGAIAAQNEVRNHGDAEKLRPAERKGAVGGGLRLGEEDGNYPDGSVDSQQRPHPRWSK
jgi:hypothetical protein